MLRLAPHALLGFALLLAGCAGESSAAFTAKAADGAPADLRGNLYRPDGPGPFPAVVLLHGCSGMGRHAEHWGRRLAGWGYMTFTVDSFRPRGYQTVCGKGLAVPPSLRARDAYAAADRLRAMPDVRADRIAAIGFSHGGWTVMQLVQAGLAERIGSPPLQAAIAYYPYCDGSNDRDPAIPTLILIGEQDDWTPAARCRALEARFRRPELVSAVYYPNAYHAFDSEARLRWAAGARGSMHRLEYDAVAAPDSFARTRAFLDRHLKP